MLTSIDSQMLFVEMKYCLVILLLPTLGAANNAQQLLEIEAQTFWFDASAAVRFLLHTRLNPTHPQSLKWDSTESVKQSFFNEKHPTRFTIHGYIGDYDSAVNELVVAEYLKVGEFNMIVVDWGEGSQSFFYPLVRNRVEAVGRTVSDMIDTLRKAYDISLTNVTLIGHSLGAHIAGAAGKAQNGKIGTIFGLDPAGWLFEVDGSDTLSANDAGYVEIIHTSNLIGCVAVLGHADFYVNEGYWQPGCIDVPTCSHSRAVELFAESISSSKGFWADGGASVRMGGEPSNQGKQVRGVFMVETDSSPPYALGP
ncbi:inactive pancreatic lipase-related protein 1-like [Malaya genurostris]|uniref:inactive pancreatic lipase-related protein 1-like n=1 Tax=Malaya genurostris TaxID=325434 RepID=UPI0026F3C90E|nr:inactive pancreatic lipase-related protein 1-like [Malaya genurostris]